MKLRLRQIFSVLGFSCVALAPLWSRSANFEVVGDTASVTYREGSVAHSSSNKFRVSVAGCSYLIHTDSPAENIDYSEFGVETNYSFHLTKYVDRVITTSFRVVDGVITEVPLKKPGKPINDSNLELNPSFVPRFSADITPVWLAFASHCYLADQNGGTIQPLTLQLPVDFREPHWRWDPAPAVWKFSVAAPGLVESLVVYRDGRTLGLPPPFQGRTTNLVYEVLQWTNIGGLTLPREFKVTCYTLDLKAKDGPRLRMENMIQGWTRQITNGLSISSFRPTVAPRTRIADYRWEAETGSPNAIVYMATEGKILGLDELIRRPESERSIR